MSDPADVHELWEMLSRFMNALEKASPDAQAAIRKAMGGRWEMWELKERPAPAIEISDVQL